MARHHHDSDPLVIPLEDGLIHTDEHPFCSIDSTCPCHDDPDRIAAVAEAVVRGELTPDEATNLVFGKLF